MTFVRANARPLRIVLLGAGLIAGATGTAMADHYYGHGGGGYYGGGGGYYSGGDYQPRHKARRHCFWVQQRFRDSYGGWFYKPVKVCE